LAEDCGYISRETANGLNSSYDAIIGKLVIMITRPDPWIIPLRKP
jgi:hypothetical protein